MSANYKEYNAMLQGFLGENLEIVIEDLSEETVPEIDTSTIMVLVKCTVCGEHATMPEGTDVCDECKKEIKS